MRVVKAYAYIVPPEYAYNQPLNNVVFINSYDGSPLYLGCGDVILSSVIETYGPTIVSSGNSVSVQLGFSSTPKFNSKFNIWEPGLTDPSSLTSPISGTLLNSGFNFRFNAIVNIFGGQSTWPLTYNTPLFNNNWINLIVNGSETVTSPNPIVKLTLLVLNSFNS
jgi:hypothetical protein